MSLGLEELADIARRDSLTLRDSDNIQIRPAKIVLNICFDGLEPRGAQSTAPGRLGEVLGRTDCERGEVDNVGRGGSRETRCLGRPSLPQGLDISDQQPQRIVVRRNLACICGTEIRDQRGQIWSRERDREEAAVTMHGAHRWIGGRENDTTSGTAHDLPAELRGGRFAADQNGEADEILRFCEMFSGDVIVGCGAGSGNDPDPTQGLKRHARLERSVVDRFDIDIRNVAAIDLAPHCKALGFRKLISRHRERRKPSRIVHFNLIIGGTIASKRLVNTKGIPSMALRSK